ncbi:hypothetical protein [Asaccharospora irregularis]|uniref:Uncharacterized protein n=1 Tax=Asaccharospora irregularis DSM 2635 TaxID=1121321 RepID=A0A1M5PNW8_9FIRM|nr:hypothetical protein [Asaccharospora irregularis]SHH03381.1 hypothetical protein SAMN04488530_11530 [Asaccharospora irregularis DSM 2635]
MYKKHYTTINIVLICAGLLLLLSNVSLAFWLRDSFLTDIGVDEKVSIEIFKSYMYMIQIIGGILFSIGLYRLTEIKNISKIK